jgi:hypothetical protein
MLIYLEAMIKIKEAGMEAKYATRPTTTKQTENALREVQHALEKEGQKMESAMEARK